MQSAAGVDHRCVCVRAYVIGVCLSVSLSLCLSVLGDAQSAAGADHLCVCVREFVCVSVVLEWCVCACMCVCAYECVCVRE